MVQESKPKSLSFFGNPLVPTGRMNVLQKDSKDDDFEHILAGLETDIREHEEALAFIVQRERRAVLLLTSYSVTAWLVYVLAWYFGALDAFSGEDDLQDDNTRLAGSTLKTLPVGAIPILSVFVPTGTPCDATKLTGANIAFSTRAG